LRQLEEQEVKQEKALKDEASKLIASLKLEAELDNEKRKSVHFLVRPAVYEKLRKISDESGVSASKIVNAMLEREIMGQA
jgi:rRNA-processing protein FCF1